MSQYKLSLQQFLELAAFHVKMHPPLTKIIILTGVVKLWNCKVSQYGQSSACSTMCLKLEHRELIMVFQVEGKVYKISVFFLRNLSSATCCLWTNSKVFTENYFTLGMKCLRDVGRDRKMKL